MDFHNIFLPTSPPACAGKKEWPPPGEVILLSNLRHVSRYYQRKRKRCDAASPKDINFLIKKFKVFHYLKEQNDYKKVETEQTETGEI